MLSLLLLAVALGPVLATEDGKIENPALGVTADVSAGKPPQAVAAVATLPDAAGTDPKHPSADESKFMDAFFASLSMIIVSELGDKTFFIAAIMAMRHSRIVVFAGAMGALAVQTVLSTVMGRALPMLIPTSWTQILAAILFFGFGLKLLWDSREMDWKINAGANEEMEEVEEELAAARKERVAADTTGEADNLLSDPELGEGGKVSKKKETSGWNTGIFIQAFAMTFMAEWGDRSQIATIVMAAAKNPYGVTVGGVLGHFLCTGLAVVGGKYASTKISERAMTIGGGVLFLLFGFHSYFWPDES